MKKEIIKINEELCIGCGICANTCLQSAIQIIDGKAKLVQEDYCDGLGRCLKKCPVDAITFITKQIDNKETSKLIKHSNSQKDNLSINNIKLTPKESSQSLVTSIVAENNLKNWPIQIKLVQTSASYYDNADLLISADCCVYTYSKFNNVFLKNRILLIGCPKLDNTDYSEKLTEIITLNNINTITLLRMEVPCCGGLEYFIKTAIKNSKKNIELFVHTISINGNII